MYARGGGGEERERERNAKWKGRLHNYVKIMLKSNTDCKTVESLYMCMQEGGGGEREMQNGRVGHIIMLKSCLKVTL